MATIGWVENGTFCLEMGVLVIRDGPIIGIIGIGISVSVYWYFSENW